MTCRVCTRELAAALGREPTHAELARRMGVTEADIGEIEAEAKRGYHNGGFKIYDVSKPAQPKRDRASQDRRHRRTSLRHGRALRLHLDRDGRLCRQHPRHLRYRRSAAAAGSIALVDAGAAHRAAARSRSWPGRQHRLHHALRFGDEMWASCWHGGFSIVDVSDIAQAAGPPAATTIIRCFRSRPTP